MSRKSLDELEHQPNPLSVKEAAEIYGESPNNFYRRIRRNEIPGVYRCKGKKKPRIKICPKEFIPWIKSLMVRPCEPPANGGREGKVA